MGGGTIIINQAQILRNAVQDPAFYDQLSGSAKTQCSGLISKPLAEWTSRDLRAASVLILLVVCEHPLIEEPAPSSVATSLVDGDETHT